MSTTDESTRPLPLPLREQAAVWRLRLSERALASLLRVNAGTLKHAIAGKALREGTRVLLEQRMAEVAAELEAQP